MIKRILVVLDADRDTPVATRYAIDIARRCGAEMTGLALVDTASIAANTKGGGIGSMYLADKVKADLTAQARGVARDLTAAFRASAEEAGVGARAETEEGVPLRRIDDDMRYHDLLVLGKVPHLFYSHPEHRTLTLETLVKNTVGPTLVVPESYREVRRIVVAHDDSAASAVALRTFVHLQPFGTDIDVAVVNVYGPGGQAASKLCLGMARSYLTAHGLEADAVSMESDDPAGAIVDCVTQDGGDLLVLGANVVPPLAKLAFGSTTASFLEKVPVPLWLGN